MQLLKFKDEADLTMKTSKLFMKMKKDWEFLNSEKQFQLITWIGNNFKHIKTINTKVGSSYQLKELFENSEKGFYINNNQFKYAMLLCEFLPDNQSIREDYENWYFNISSRSKAFKN